MRADRSSQGRSKQSPEARGELKWPHVRRCFSSHGLEYPHEQVNRWSQDFVEVVRAAICCVEGLPEKACHESDARVKCLVRHPVIARGRSSRA